MSEVKRYEVTEMGATYHKRTEMLLSDEGCWVDYEDYAALEQDRNKLNEECIKHNNMAFKYQQRAEAAEAKLAELEKQAPVAWRYRTTNIQGKLNPDWSFSDSDSLMGLYQPLYAKPRPAPAADLAQLVPDECPEGITDKMEEAAGISLDEQDCQDLWSVCRAPILRNIEEAK